jgi:hypothetical protein
LTDRRESSASNTPSIKDRIKNLEASTKPTHAVAEDNGEAAAAQVDGTIDKKPTPRKLSITSLDEVNLGEGELDRGLLTHHLG